MLLLLLFEGKQRVSQFYHDLGLELVGLLGNFRIVEQLLPLFVEQLLNPINSLIQSCFKEIFGGRRGDLYTFSFLTSPVSIRTTFGIQQAGSVS